MSTLPLVLPPDLAYLAAADQNFDRDIRKKLVAEKQWQEEKEVYLQEAFISMQVNGRNYPPYFKDHEQIEVSPVERKRTYSTRASMFMKALDDWYDRQALAIALGLRNEVLRPSPVFYLNVR